MTKLTNFTLIFIKSLSTKTVRKEIQNLYRVSSIVKYRYNFINKISLKNFITFNYIEKHTYK